MATALENAAPAVLLDPTGKPDLPLGDTVVNGAALIAHTGLHAAASGSYASGVGIFVRSHNPYHPYVVWTTILRPTGEVVVEQGDYCETIGEALKRYEARGGVA